MFFLVEKQTVSEGAHLPSAESFRLSDSFWASNRAVRRCRFLQKPGGRLPAVGLGYIELDALADFALTVARVVEHEPFGD